MSVELFLLLLALSILAGSERAHERARSSSAVVRVRQVVVFPHLRDER